MFDPFCQEKARNIRKWVISAVVHSFWLAYQFFEFVLDLFVYNTSVDSPYLFNWKKWDDSFFLSFVFFNKCFIFSFKDSAMLIRKDLPLKHVTIKAFWHCQSSFARPVILVILICILTPDVYLQPSPALRFAQVTSCRLSVCLSAWFSWNESVAPLLCLWD